MTRQLTLVFILSILISILFVKCEEPTKVETTGKISGTVSDSSTSQKLSNVTITSDPVTSSKSTDSQGSFLIEGVEPGTYSVKAAKEGYSDNTVMVNVVAGETASADIQLTLVAPVLSVSVTSLDFGITSTTLPFTISNTGFGELTWTVTENADWIAVNPMTGTTTDSIPLITVTVDRSGLDAGDYSESISIASNGGSATIVVAMSIQGPISITSGPNAPRQGDVVLYTAETRDINGAVVDDTTLTWSVLPMSAGLFAADGYFVGYIPGPAKVVATVLDPKTEELVADTLEITITARGLTGSFSVIGHGAVTNRNSSHIAVNGAFAYTGTIGCYRSCGDRLYVWDISNPANPTLTGSVFVGGSRVLDVMISTDGMVLAVTNEGGSNGLTLLDLSDPANPAVITRLTAGLEPDTHNLWIDGDHIYVAITGILNQTQSRLAVVDISNLQNPVVVATYYPGSVGTHDVHVRDGLAIVSNWGEAGLIILDVGGGGAGGSPANPIELSRTQIPQGWVHNAWYWPATGYVFIGEEPQVVSLFPHRGTIYVMDAREPSSPQLVATYTIRGFNPHNFYLDEDRMILYVAWEANGVRAIDVSGKLMGELELQGREIARMEYDGSGTCVSPGTCSLSLQLQNGLIYVSDFDSGLWVLQPSF